MSIRLVGKGAPRRLALIIALACALPQVFFPLALPKDYPVIYPMLLAVVLFAYVLLVFGLRIEVKSWWAMILEQVCIAGISAVVIHLPMYFVDYAAMQALLHTGFIMLVFQFLALAITGNGKWCGAVVMTVCWLYGVINFEVFQFTENMISLDQILSVRTGIEVMDNYRFVMGPYVISSTILYVTSMIALFRIKDSGMKRVGVRVTALICAALSTIMPIDGYNHMRLRTWKASALHDGNGIPLELILEYKFRTVPEPENYSAERVAKLADYAPAEPAAETAVRPHVIAIMIESYADLSVLGDIETNVDPIPYTHSLANESIHGYYLASTFAAGTPRTEWEFLTGNSMLFLNLYSVAYKQYVLDDQNSLARVFKNAGYHTIGMHNYEGGNWERDRVYPLLGFDDVYFEEDLEWDGRVRKYISDSAFMHQVIHLYEDHMAKQTGEPLFFFGVTMQDHGGYMDATFQSDVHVLNVNADCSVTDQYLSLTKLTDDAIRELVEYFRAVDEPVEIVFFGDHQPRLTDDFYNAIPNMHWARKFVVPYVIWRNYDSTAEELDMTSANFLPMRVAKAAGVALPAYYGFLEQLSGKVPIISGVGYQYNGEFRVRDVEATGDAKELLNEYQCYQYANMFDDTADDALFQGTPAAGAGSSDAADRS